MYRSSFLIAMIFVFVLSAGSTVSLADDTLQRMEEIVSSKKNTGYGVLEEAARADNNIALLLKDSPGRIRARTEEVANRFLPKLSNYLAIEDPKKAQEEAHSLAAHLFDGKVYDYNVKLLLTAASVELLDKSGKAKIARFVEALYECWSKNKLKRIVKIGGVALGAFVATAAIGSIVFFAIKALNTMLSRRFLAWSQYLNSTSGALTFQVAIPLVATAAIGAGEAISFGYVVHHLFRLNPAMAFSPATRDEALQAMKNNEPVSLDDVEFTRQDSHLGHKFLRIDQGDLHRQ